MSVVKQLACRENHTVLQQLSTVVLTQHINYHCQFCLKQASSTSLAVINCLLCFPMILSKDGRHWLQLGILGLVSGSTSHRSHDLSFPSSPPAPLTFRLCPRWVQDGLAVVRWGGVWQWLMAQARTWSTCQDFSCTLRGIAITIIGNNWSIMKMDGVSSECSRVTSWSNSQRLFHSITRE